MGLHGTDFDERRTYSCNHDTSPSSAIASANISDSSQKVAEDVDRPSTIDVGQRYSQKRSDAGEDNVHRKLVRSLDDSNVELFAQRYESRIHNCSGHGSKEGKK